MNAEIEVQGIWHSIEFIYPNVEPPIEVTGPLGMQSVMPSPDSKYNAKIVTHQIIQPGTYTIRQKNQLWVFDALKIKFDYIWGDVRSS